VKASRGAGEQGSRGAGEGRIEVFSYHYPSINF